MERAETMARLLEVGSRIALMPSAGHGYRSEWDSLLQASGTAAGAVHIPLGLLPLKADPKAPDYDARLTGKPVAVFCAAGARAGRAVALLEQFGHEAVNIGGFADWCGCGGEVQPHA